MGREARWARGVRESHPCQCRAPVPWSCHCPRCSCDRREEWWKKPTNRKYVCMYIYICIYKISQGFISNRNTPVTIPRPGARRGVRPGRGSRRGRAAPSPGGLRLQLGKTSGRLGAAAGVAGCRGGERKGRELLGSVLSLHNESGGNVWGKVGCRNKVLCLALGKRVEM